MRHLYEDEQLRDEPARTGCSLPVSPRVGGDGPVSPGVGVGGRGSGIGGDGSEGTVRVRGERFCLRSYTCTASRV